MRKSDKYTWTHGIVSGKGGGIGTNVQGSPVHVRSPSGFGSASLTSLMLDWGQRQFTARFLKPDGANQTAALTTSLPTDASMDCLKVSFHWQHRNLALPTNLHSSYYWWVTTNNQSNIHCFKMKQKTKPRQVTTDPRIDLVCNLSLHRPSWSTNEQAVTRVICRQERMIISYLI